MKRDITLGLACSMDFDGLYFTLNAIHLYHPNFFQACEILLLDNEDKGYSSWPMRLLANKLNRLTPTKYICLLANSGQAYVKQKLIENAQTDWVFICDSHVLFLPGSLDALLRYIAEAEDKVLITGVMCDESLDPICTNLKPEWSFDRFGEREMNKEKYEAGEAFEVVMAELHAFACRKESWPGIPGEFKAATHEEYYVYEKLRENGGKGICLPSLRYIHKGLRFFSPSTSRVDIARNYLLTWRLLGKDETEVKERLFRGFSEEVQNKILSDLEGKPIPSDSQSQCCKNPEGPSKTLSKYDELKTKLITYRLESIDEILSSEENWIYKILQTLSKYFDQAKEILCFSPNPIYLAASLFSLVPEGSSISVMSLISTIQELTALREYGLRNIKTTPIYAMEHFFRIPKELKYDLIVLEFSAPELTSSFGVLESVLQNNNANRIILLGILSSQQAIDQVAQLLLKYPQYSIVHVKTENQGAYILSNLPEDKPKLPSLIKMATNFIQAIAKHIVTGANMVDKETLEKRLLVCSICEHRNEDRCSVCGCFLISENEKMGKALWKDQHCPLSKWK